MLGFDVVKSSLNACFSQYLSSRKFRRGDFKQKHILSSLFILAHGPVGWGSPLPTGVSPARPGRAALTPLRSSAGRGRNRVKFALSLRSPHQPRHTPVLRPSPRSDRAPQLPTVMPRLSHGRPADADTAGPQRLQAAGVAVGLPTSATRGE